MATFFGLNLGIEQYRFIPGLGVPVVVTVLGVFAKRFARSQVWDRSHFYLGTELTLAALAASLVNLGDILRPDVSSPANLKKLVGLDVLWAVITFILLFFVISLHQQWEPKTTLRPNASFFWLNLISNVIGFGLLAAVVILIPVS